jgi:hypothetical protein
MSYSGNELFISFGIRSLFLILVFGHFFIRATFFIVLLAAHNFFQSFSDPQVFDQKNQPLAIYNPEIPLTKRKEKKKKEKKMKLFCCKFLKKHVSQGKGS